MLGSDVHQQVRLQFSMKRADRAPESRADFVRSELRTFNFMNVNQMVSEVVFLGCLMVANRTRKSWTDTAFVFDMLSQAPDVFVSAEALVALEWI